MSKGQLCVIGALALVAIAGGALYWEKREVLADAEALDAIASSPLPAAVRGGEATQVSDSAPRQAPRTAMAVKRIRVGDPLYPSADDAGIAWLEKNGYPSAFEFSATSGRRPMLADINLKDGISATELLDLELLAAQDEEARQQAVAQLNQAVAMGSMYALEVLGRVYASQRNYVWSEAYFKASQIRGNWAAELRMKPRLTSGEGVLAAIMAQQIIDSANIARQRNGLGPLAHDSRPGAEQALIAIRAQIAQERQQQGR